MAPIHNARAIDTGHPAGASGMISIRPMEDRNVGAARDLVAQLGYPMEQADFRRRYAAVATAASHALMIAEDQGRVAALCHVFLRPALDKPPEAVVQALVVDEAWRGRGIGAALMARAEEWAARQGLRSVVLASHIARDDAHRFYQSLGYRQVATPHLLRKDRPDTPR